jgi:hypothetical protein
MRYRDTAQATHVEHYESLVKTCSMFLDGSPILDKPPESLERWLRLPVKNVLPDLVYNTDGAVGPSGWR